MTVDVLIPTFRPGKRFALLMEWLARQDYPIHQVIILNTEKAFFPAHMEERYADAQIHHLTRAQFDHGGTRDRGIRLSAADVVVCMTQDAVPADETLIGKLIEPFSNPAVWASYARQLPIEGCSEIERCARSFNYPEESRLKGAEDLPALGIKAFFCSNVCAAWRRDKYLELGGFAKKTIFNEDMIYAGTLIRNGGRIAYCADAKVRHSHNYTAMQQFHRYFDLAVSQKMHPEVFGGIRSESEGMRLALQTMRRCIQIKKPWLIASAVGQNAGKILGYKMGQRYRRLPRKLILWCTMNRSFWREE